MNRGGLGRLLYVVVVVLGTMVAVLSGGCNDQQPIQVGFAGELTGINSDLGVYGRNGAQLAVEELNASGGIAGRPLKLLVRDDLGTPEGAIAADRSLIKAGVVAIIGHMTSRQSLAALPTVNEARVVLISSATALPDLSGQDDYFFYICSTNTSEAQALAQHVYRERGLSRLAVIYDLDNAPFSRSYWNGFAEAYRSLGGQPADEVGFSSDQEPDFRPLLLRLRATDADGLLIVAPPIDTALICQQARAIGWQVPLFTSAWAQSETFLQNGGQAIEGIELVTSYDSNSQSPSFLDFQERYLKRFGRPSSFAAARGHETMMVLAAALGKTGGRAEGLRQALTQTKDFPGVTGNITMNQYGDIVRPNFLLTVRNGQLVTVSAIEPQ